MLSRCLEGSTHPGGGGKLDCKQRIKGLAEGTQWGQMEPEWGQMEPSGPLGGRDVRSRLHAGEARGARGRGKAPALCARRAGPRGVRRAPPGLGGGCWELP